MKTVAKLLVLLELLWVMPGWASDGWGPCKPDNGPNQFTANPVITINSPSDNYAGYSMPRAFFWDVEDSYFMTCQCPDDASQTRRSRIQYVDSHV